MSTYETAIVLGDTQIPYHDQSAIDVVLKKVREVQPEQIILIGDILDFPYLTTKFLRAAADPTQLLEDISTARGLILQLRIASPNSFVKYIEGNHEARLHNYVLECAPALEGLLGKGHPLNLRSLLDPDDDLIHAYYEPYGAAYIYKSFVFKHGDYTGPTAASKELMLEGSSGMSGHTHSVQSVHRTDRKGAHGWYSIGCLCHIGGSKAPPAKRQGPSVLQNWQQGFGIVHFGKGRRFNAYSPVITRGEIVA